MKKKILVIFLLAIIFSIIIYNFYIKRTKKVLIISDNYSISKLINGNNNKNYQFNIYRYDNITYKELINNIKNNDNKIVKDKKIYLNQLISSSDIIIMNINNSEYFNKCKKNDNILKNYDNILSMHINDLNYILSRITNAKIYIIGNYCKNKNYVQELNIPFEYIKYSNIYENKI